MQEAASNPPDWATIEKDLLCPLCGYNLRGLTDPRCPECGFQFSWLELIDADRNRHPYLFEYGKGRNFRTFIKTSFLTSFPRRFWRGVNPAQNVNVARLMVYCIISCTIFFSCLAIVYTPYPKSIVDVATSSWRIRGYFSPVQGKPGYFAATRGGGPKSIYTSRGLDMIAPLPWQSRFWEIALRLQRGHGETGEVVYLASGWAAIFMVWPILTLAPLLIFRISMRQAKIKIVHLCRAIIYSCDFSLLLICAAFAFQFIDIPFHEGGYFVAMATTCTLITTYRLTIAFRKYLRVHLPLATVIASQVIAFLITFLVLIQVADFTRRI